MKGILIAGVFVVFAISVIDSLKCRQCYSPTESCSDEATECKGEGFLSCVESLVNSTLGGSHYLYQNSSCSANNCAKNSNTQVAFTVHVFDNQTLHFSSQCCQGEACNDTNHETGTQGLTNTQCSACYSYNTTDCQEKTRQCFQGERCVHIIAEFVNGKSGTSVKGCSDISESTCETLALENRTIGEFVFQSVKCENATVIPVTTNTPPASTGVKASFTSSVFGSLLLLKLLF
ncbi:ly6/PLAUR domain-containing protein 8-like [Onychomys torridus]|uniref:ly6/PLAUR domain-containing protein 8-like n=1 Tax=Onychomys torridus TaxID=38674 RepID=UPI00167FBD3E|nr:ly6/PLAUR domain-containing protein 8-like [Onychomys torridus]